MRPDIIHVGGVLYWTIQTRNPDTQVLKDADSTPSVAVRKNGSSVADSVTIMKRSATTGLYDCSYNPAAEVEGDTFQFEERAQVTGTTTTQQYYDSQFSVRAVHAGVVELDSSSITAVQSGLATAASITTLRGADNDTLKTLSDQIDSISSGGTDWTADQRTAIKAILGIPDSGTTPGDPSTGILDTIRDLVSAYIAGIAAAAQLVPGTIVGFPETLNIGDSYTDDCNSAIHVFIRDDNDDPITAVGTHDFTDGDFAPECTITQNGNTGRVKCEVTYVTASPENYLKIQIPSKESRRATAGIATVQVLLKWDGAQKALSKQTVTWEALI